MPDYVAAIDQGTTSTRFMIFDHSGNEVGKYQLEHEQILPQAGWVEHNPIEIWERTSAVAQTVLSKHRLDARDLDRVADLRPKVDRDSRLNRVDNGFDVGFLHDASC